MVLRASRTIVLVRHHLPTRWARWNTGLHLLLPTPHTWYLVRRHRSAFSCPTSPRCSPVRPSRAPGICIHHVDRVGSRQLKTLGTNSIGSKGELRHSSKLFSLSSSRLSFCFRPVPSMVTSPLSIHVRIPSISALVLFICVFLCAAVPRSIFFAL